jgi:hypothetical protein
MFRKLLSLDILSRIRSPFWQKSIGINIVLILLGIYLMLNFLALGFILDNVILHFYPDADPLQVFNRFFLYYLVYDLIMRFFMQNLPVTSIKNYLLLPIRRSKLVHYLLVKSIPTFFNILPFLFLFPFLFTVVIPNWGAAAWVWIILSALLVLINHWLAILLKRSFMIRPLPAIGLVVGILAVAYFDFQGALPFSEAFGNWLSWTAQNAWSLIIPLLVFIALYYTLYRLFYNNIYLDKLMKGDQEEASEMRHLAWLGRFGKIGRLIQLDLQLIRRNKRPRVYDQLRAVHAGLGE